MGIRTNIFIFFCILFTEHINAQSVGGTVAGGDNEYCSPSESIFISVTGEVGTITAWEFSTNGGATWTNTGTISDPQPVNPLTQTTCFRVIVKDGVNEPDTSNSHCITIYQNSIGGNIVGGGTFCIGNDTLTLEGFFGDIIRWQSSINNGSSWTPISNITETLIVSGISESNIYEAVVQSNALCEIDTSTQGEIEITLSNGGTTTGGGTFCEESSNGELTLSGNTGDVVAWCYSINNGTTWETINDSTDTLNYISFTENRLYKALVKLGSCPIDTSSQTEFIVNISDAGIIMNDDITVEYNTNGANLLVSETDGSNFNWLFSEDDGITWNSTGGTDSSYTFSHLITSTHFRAEVQKSTCIKDTSNTVIITVLPKAVADVSNFFTPNGDGYNDYWYIKGIENFPDNEVTIFNTDGFIVFSAKGYTNDWAGTFNGKQLPDGTYYYVVKVEEKDLLLKGTINILIKN